MTKDSTVYSKCGYIVSTVNDGALDNPLLDKLHCIKIVKIGGDYVGFYGMPVIIGSQVVNGRVLRLKTKDFYVAKTLQDLQKFADSGTVISLTEWKTVCEELLSLRKRASQGVFFEEIVNIRARLFKNY